MSEPLRIVFWQGLAGIAIAVLWWFLGSAQQSFSALLATACVALPNGFFAWMTGRSLDATRLLMHGVLKFVATVTAIGVSIVTIGVEPLSFFSTLAVVYVVFLLPIQPKKTHPPQARR